MYAKTEIQRLEKELDKLFDNRIAKVAKESGKSYPTVSKFFNFQKIKPSSAEKIYKTCIRLMQNKVKERKSNARKVTRLSNELNKGN